MSTTKNCESYHRTQTRLLEIYKIQINAVNDISNRRVNINRHYLIIMSGIVIVFTAFTQLDVEKSEHLKLFIKYFPIAIGIIGCVISSIWLLVTDSYLRRNSRKYEVLKHLESNLEYNFLSTEWSILGTRKSQKNYRSLATIEFATPLAFFVTFGCFYVFGIIQIEPRKIFKYVFPIIPVICFVLLFGKIVMDHKQGKNETSRIRKSYRNND